MASSSIAVNNRRYNTTLYIDILFFDKLADIANQYLKSGSKICIQGSLDLEKYQDRSGNNRQKHKVIVKELEMLDCKESNKENNTFGEFTPSNHSAPISIDEDEIPF